MNWPILVYVQDVHLYVYGHIFRTSTITISISFTLLKLPGLPSYYSTVAHMWSRQNLCLRSKV